MISVEIENNLKPNIDKMFDLEEIAWGLFQCVDNRVPVDTGRLKSSAELIAGTRTLIRSPDLQHGSTLIRRFTVSLKYSTPKPVSANANVFYMYGSGRWFDYAYKQEQEVNYLKQCLDAHLNGVIRRAMRFR